VWWPCTGWRTAVSGSPGHGRRLWSRRSSAGVVNAGGWFLAALVVGALVAGLLGSATRLTGYPVLSATVPTGVLLPLLADGGVASPRW